MKPYDANILFTSTLLGFDEPSCAIQANDQAASDFGIQSSAVTSLFNSVDYERLCLLLSRALFNVPEYTLDPSDHLMTRRISRFVEVDHTGANEGFEVALERSTSYRNWREMPGSDE